MVIKRLRSTRAQGLIEYGGVILLIAVLAIGALPILVDLNNPFQTGTPLEQKRVWAHAYCAFASLLGATPEC